MDAKELRQLADNCLDWYWSHGHQRDGQYAVSRGSCLDQLYAVRNRAAAVERSGLDPRPCMALWGPSQTGKSTLLAGYLDIDGDDLGRESVLTWSPEEPVRFGGELKSDGSNIVINPYNGGADGSGCISRFVMAEVVPDPTFPVDISIATETQILHALAAGYESECHPRNNTGEETYWGPESFRTLMDGVKELGPPDRAGFEALHRLADVIDLLVVAGIRRYANLADQWQRNLRPMLLENRRLANKSALNDFTCELLWDSWPSLTSLCDRLHAKRAEVVSIFGQAPRISSTWRLAAVLLDIDAYKHYSRDSPQVKGFVDSVGYTSTSDGAIGLGGSHGTRLFRTGEDFGLFQGLVWELRLPLRRSVLEARAPVVAKFFETADLMDFPGVSNEHEGAKKITDSDLSQSLARGLTEVLKRGKTASIAVSRAAELDIDGFSILARAGKHPGQPKQLVAGIRSWMAAYGESWPPKGKTMPLNLIITFCAKLVNDVCSGGIRNGLDSYFSLFAKLADLADPKVVTMFTTTYPWLLSEGKIAYPEDVYRPKVDEILADRAFLERFGENQDSFKHMVRDGGSLYLFSQLTEQAKSSRRPRLLAQRLADASNTLVKVMVPHLAAENASADERNLALERWESGIMMRLKDKPGNEHEYDPAATLSQRLRGFLNIDQEDLEPLPQRAITRRVGIEAFVSKQYHNWRSSRSTFPELDRLGFEDSAHAQRILAALIEAADLAAVLEFVRDNLGNLSSKSAAENARRFLAIKMTNEMLMAGAEDESVETSSQQRLELLRSFANAEASQVYDPESSPHYLSVIKPLLHRIAKIKKMQAGDRPAQVGDAELSAMISPYVGTSPTSSLK